MSPHVAVARQGPASHPRNFAEYLISTRPHKQFPGFGSSISKDLTVIRSFMLKSAGKLKPEGCNFLLKPI